MRLSDLTPEQRENLSTEEIIQIASKLSPGEYLGCEVSITPIMSLVVYLDSKAYDYGWRGSPKIYVKNRAHIKRILPFATHHVHIQRETDQQGLHVRDFIDIFELEPSVKWRLVGVERDRAGET